MRGINHCSRELTGRCYISVQWYRYSQQLLEAEAPLRDSISACGVVTVSFD